MAIVPNNQELTDLLGTAKTELNLDVPFWAKLLLFFLKFIPGIPGWIIAALPIVIGIIEKLPFVERRAARKELMDAAKTAAKTKSTEAVEAVFKRVCVGSVCNIVKVDDNRLK
jgi:flagellar biosynthesis component FlhA